MSGTGFFGKLPASGDFVARGLAPGWRAPLDRWLTRMLAPHAARPWDWPQEGVGAALVLAGAPVLIWVLPSRDAAGREFPLAACTALNGADLATAADWSAQVRGPLGAAVAGMRDAADLGAELAPLLTNAGAGAALCPPLLWAQGWEPDTPETMVPRLFP